MSLLTGDFATDRPDAIALIDERRRVTWAELDQRVDQVRAALAGAGLGEGSTVVVMAGNQIELFELTLACIQSGVLLVPVNWHVVADELRYILDDAGADALVVDERWARSAIDAGAPDRAIVIGDDAPDGFETWKAFTDARRRPTCPSRSGAA